MRNFKTSVVHLLFPKNNCLTYRRGNFSPLLLTFGSRRRLWDKNSPSPRNATQRNEPGRYRKERKRGVYTRVLFDGFQ